MDDPESPRPSMLDGMWTLPNAFTFVRLLCLPVFLWLLFDQDNRSGAAWMLGALGSTDWIDGYLARRLGQVSEFGKVFDPTVDRLLFIVAITAIMIDDAMPIWFGVAVLSREILVGAMMAVATVVFKIDRIDVTWLGKLATFLLMFAIPGFLMGNSDITGAEWFTVASWIVGVPGLVLSYYTGIMYVPEVRRRITDKRARRTPGVVPSTS